MSRTLADALTAPQSPLRTSLLDTVLSPEGVREIMATPLPVPLYPTVTYIPGTGQVLRDGEDRTRERRFAAGNCPTAFKVYRYVTKPHTDAAYTPGAPTNATKFMLCHRAAMAALLGYWPTVMVDHIDEDGLNNRADNLRLATNSDNQSRRASPNPNMPLGVTYNEGAELPYTVKFNGRIVGRFPDLTAAAFALWAIHDATRGEFAYGDRHIPTFQWLRWYDPLMFELYALEQDAVWERAGY